jgi:uncharacterized protein (DUF1499 family)
MGIFKRWMSEAMCFRRLPAAGWPLVRDGVPARHGGMGVASAGGSAVVFAVAGRWVDRVRRIGIVAPVLVAAMTFGGGTVAANAEEQSTVDYVDFAQLQRQGSPNDFLVAPADETARLGADAQSPRFPVPAARLARLWADVVSAEPRTRILGTTEDGLGIEAEQRTAVFRFVDRVSFRAVPIDADSSSAYVYSRSQVGYWDLGVNQRRVENWLNALEVAAAAQ